MHSGDHNEAKELLNLDASSPPGAFTVAAREYFASCFPNPSRQGCPAEEEIEALIHAQISPDRSLRSHLFGCSNCFNVYNLTLKSWRKTVSAQTAWWSRVGLALQQMFRRPVPLFAALIVLLSSLGIFYALRSVRPTEPTTTVSSVSTHPTAIAPDTQAEPEAQPTTAVQAEKPKAGLRDQTAQAQIILNFQQFSVLRESDGSVVGTKPDVVTRGHNRFLILLPAESPKGPYTVSVVDAFGGKLLEKRANSDDGKRLTFELDLSKIASEHSRLCVARAEEIPDCHPILVRDQ